MDISDGIADLHLHTTASDGTCSVSDRLKQAHNRNLQAIAITDHDSIAEDLDGRRTAHEGLELITGVEVRADVQNTKVELLGYYVNPSDDRLTSMLEEVRGYRRERNRQMIDRLHEITGLDRSYEDIRGEADGILGRPHIANVLVEEGIVDSVGAPFEEYLGGEGAAFVPMKRIPAPEVIDAIQTADGVASLAHPGRTRTDTIEKCVSDLAKEGLDGIEVQYPYAEAPSEEYAEVTPTDAATLADEYGLIQTGGSDCHGPDSGKFRIGDVRVTREQLDTLRKRASKRRSL